MRNKRILKISGSGTNRDGVRGCVGQGGYPAAWLDYISGI